MQWNVYVTRRIPETGIKMLEKNSAQVEMNIEDRSLTKEELLQHVEGKHAILTIVTDMVDKEVLNTAKDLKVVANYGVGFNNIDLETATRKGVMVTNTPDVLTDAVADFAWALILSISRRIVESDHYMRTGKYKTWAPMIFLGGDMYGRTLGIIGAGRIGEATAMRSSGFNMNVLYYDTIPNQMLEKKINAKRVSLDELLKESDYVSIHVPLLPETEGMIGSREIGLMKKTAYIINTARGPIINENALVQALKSNQIAGAALDVFENEPEMEPGLTELNNVIVTPHIGSGTIETRNNMSVMCAENIIAALKGERPPYIVNPEVLKTRRV